MARLPYAKPAPPSATHWSGGTPKAAVKKSRTSYGSLNDTEKSYVNAWTAQAPDVARTRRNRMAGRLNKSTYYSHIDPQRLYEYFGSSDDCYEDVETSPEDFFDSGEEVFVPFEGTQFSLALETVEELENRHRQAILGYQKAVERMAVSAMMWDQLMADAEEFESIRDKLDELMMLIQLYR